ncbi:IclR family transcriptional regulator [Mycolicibacterium sp. P9-64]|uniref:IclR family transcriptional regulator n=1 Tax=Mycolicibacterium sp. P9-64 TaxID=2024612 RepID=UPI0011EFC3E8|nr:IclR family transcriptional regulator [Mycolicibacterium sp. P9-64]KAA0077451.1 IclR family transcriptional regulator [Mycolicibacterium sp. P9-64]
MTEDSTGEGTGRGVAAVQSVDRALMVMEIVAKLGAAGVTEIASELGVHKSTVSRLIAVLESRGYVEQLSERGKYRLGFSIVRLAGSTSAPMDLTRQGQSTLDALATETGETTNIAILDGDRIINVVEAIGSAGVALRTWVGQSCAAHTTSSGKVLLSELSAADLRSRLGERLESFTPNTIVTLAALEAELATVRANGWAAVNEELEIGLNAVSGPIRDSAGEIIAALSISGPSYRLEPSGFEAMGRRAIVAADQISRRLGFSG